MAFSDFPDIPKARAVLRLTHSFKFGNKCPLKSSIKKEHSPEFDIACTSEHLWSKSMVEFA